MDLAKLIAQWEAIKAAPLPFLLALAAFVAAIWIAINYLYSTRLENLKAERDLAIRQREDYKDKLQGASPDQAKAQLEALQQQVRFVTGAPWRRLTAAEMDRLSAAFSKLPRRRVQVMYENQFGKELAKDFADALTRGGFTDILYSPGSGFDVGIATGRGNGFALDLKATIERETGFRLTAFGPTEPDTPNIAFIGVGIYRDN